MFRLKKMFGRIAQEKKKEPAPTVPYAQRAKLFPLSAVFTIVPRHQEDFFIDTYFDIGAAVSFVLYAHSDPPREILAFLGADETKKTILLTLGRSEYVDKMDEAAYRRFSSSQVTRGISFAVPVRKIFSIAAYRFLSDEKKDWRLGKAVELRNEKKEKAMEQEKKEQQAPLSVAPSKGGDAVYEAVFAIVNKGYTDLVMEASRKQGARGGTILTARGTGNPDLEKYYGFSIQPEKEIVVILVERDLADKVVKAVCEDVGLKTNGQGIVFSLPVGRVAGLTAQDLSQNQRAD